MTDHELTPLEVAAVHRRPMRRSTLVTVLTFITGFFAVLLLGLGILVWISHSTISANLTIDQWGMKKTLWIRRGGAGALLFGLGVWFTIITRGLWQGHRYGRIMGWITVVLIVLIAILLAVS
jgi:hypothetical protein